MPITKGAEKANRQSKKKHIFNIRRKSVMSDVVKDVNKAVVAGDAKKQKNFCHLHTRLSTKQPSEVLSKTTPLLVRSLA